MLALRLPSSAMMREPLRSVAIGSVILGDSGVANASKKKMETSGEPREGKLEKVEALTRLGHSLFKFASCGRQGAGE